VRTWPALDIQQADDLVEAFLIDFNLAAIDNSTFFFHSDDDRDRAAAALCHAFPQLTIQAIDVPDEDWAARSQAALRAVTVGGLMIAPPWDVPAGIGDPGSGIGDRGSGVGRTLVVIQPSMGFGTGHHATTRLCLAALQQIDLQGKSVIDIGTGSGVLAITASLLGAVDVVGIDDDADAVRAARENLLLNPSTRVNLLTSDFRIPGPGSPIPSSFDIVLANLTGGLLEATAERLQSFARPGGHLVLSGFLDFEELRVLHAFGLCAVESRNQEDEWVCVVLTRRR
jgi:ribosomal protein L11 methyltransferase